MVAEDREAHLWRGEHDQGTNTVWRRLPEVPNGLGSWSAGGFAVLALDRTGKAWVLGRNRFGVLATRWVRKSDEWLPVEGVNAGIAGMAGFGVSVMPSASVGVAS